MILFTDEVISGVSIPNILGFLSYCTLDKTGTTISGNIELIPEASQTNWPKYKDLGFGNVPYNPALPDIRKQVYTWLMANDSRFTGGSQYPAL